MDARSLIDRLSLEPLPGEGGWYRETHRNGKLSTTIYYLLAAGEVSRIHRLASDEVWHFYLGDPVELYVFKGGGCERFLLGGDLEKGHSPQALVPSGAWQGARLAGNGRLALMGTTVSPAFEFGDFEAAKRDVMAAEFPGHKKIIEALTDPL